MNSQLYTDYKNIAFAFGALTGVCCSIAHAYMRWRGYRNLDIVYVFAQCALYVSVWALCYGMYLDVTGNMQHCASNIGALVIHFLKYYAYFYGTMIVVGLLALIAMRKQLYKIMLLLSICSSRAK